jgi:ribonucleoside-diphosphate reductase alpha chain
MTKNPDVRFAKSIVDYIFRWLAAKFLSPEAQYRAGVNNRDEVVVTTPEQLPLDVKSSAAAVPQPKVASFAAIQNQEDAPPCSTCGSIMVRSGACYKCTNCGTTSGCA